MAWEFLVFFFLITIIIIFIGPARFGDCDMKVQRLKDMGVNEHTARAVLSKENWNLEKATESLFS